MGYVLRSQSESLGSRLHRIEELLDRFHEVIPVQILPTFQPLEPITDALPQAHYQPSVLLGLFPYLAPKVVIGKTGRHYFINSVPLLDGIPREQCLFIKNVNIVCEINTLLGLLASEQVGKEEHLQVVSVAALLVGGPGWVPLFEHLLHAVEGGDYLGVVEAIRLEERELLRRCEEGGSYDALGGLLAVGGLHAAGEIAEVGEVTNYKAYLVRQHALNSRQIFLLLLSFVGLTLPISWGSLCCLDLVNMEGFLCTLPILEVLLPHELAR